MESKSFLDTAVIVTPKISPTWHTLSRFLWVSLLEINFHIFIFVLHHHIWRIVRRDIKDGGEIKKDMPDGTKAIYIRAAGADPRKRQATNAESCGPQRPDIIYYLLCIIQTAIHLQLVILLASGLSHSLSYQLTRFNANGSTQKQCLHINYWQRVVHG